MKNTTWFDETFLPSLEERMNNPKYPNRVILSEKQAAICEKYMRYDKYSNMYKYEIGTKNYTMYYAGRYTFLTMNDDSKTFFYVYSKVTKDYLVTFKTEQELIDWLDEYSDDVTGEINYNGTSLDLSKWYTGVRRG